MRGSRYRGEAVLGVSVPLRGSRCQGAGEAVLRGVSASAGVPVRGEAVLRGVSVAAGVPVPGCEGSSTGVEGLLCGGEKYP